MKKEISLLCIFLLFFSFYVTAQETAVPFGEQDVEDIQNTINQIPINEQGKIDPEKLANYTSKAEQRIAEINKWLDKNTSWLKIIFGMKPEISWIFFLNLFLIVVFLVYARNIAFIAITKEWMAAIFGILVTVVLIQVGASVKLAEYILGLFKSWWFYLIVIAVLIIIAYFGGAIGKFTEQFRKKVFEKKVEKAVENSEKTTQKVEKVESFIKPIQEMADNERSTFEEF